MLTFTPGVLGIFALMEASWRVLRTRSILVTGLWNVSSGRSMTATFAKLCLAGSCWSETMSRAACGRPRRCIFACSRWMRPKPPSGGGSLRAKAVHG